MNEVSQMSYRQMCKAIRNAISLQESVGGALPCDSPDGPMTNQYGQAVAPASHSVQQESKKAKMISATSGLNGFDLSASASLQQFLENRLQEQLPMDGGMMRRQIWKVKITPAGRQYCQLAVSALSTEEKDCGLQRFIPTPTACDHKGSANPRQGRGAYNNLRDWFRMNYGFLYPPVAVVAWLMGFNAEHLSSMVLAMQSYRKSRRRS